MPVSAIVEVVRAQAARSPERKAVAAGEKTLSYAELERHAAAAAIRITQKARGDIRSEERRVGKECRL